MKKTSICLTLACALLSGCFDHRKAPERLVKAESLKALSPQTQALILTNAPALSLPQSLTQAAALRELHLRGTKVKGLEILPRIKALALADLSSTGLETLPPELTACAGLTTLYLADNSLTTLPDLSRLEKLTYLNLDRNRLATLGPLPKSLRWIRLNANCLTTLPESFATLNPERLYLADNRLTTVPEQIKGWTRLTDLDLGGNPVEVFPEWLAQMASLKNLSLRGSQISHLPKDLSGLKNLSILDLSHCRIPEAEQRRIRAAFSVYRTHIIF
ncbi:MAG: leucine-rich repeat domain-containing protein [Kiritimatiellia bacterium]|nr:leucine-rich repeat domain-containing protein [Kiritimatiellia bacterium]